MDIHIREARQSDLEPTRHLVVAAFHDNAPQETAAFLDALRGEGCILGEWLAEDASGPIGHIVFSRVWVETQDGGRIDAAMLTPLAVRPDRQRKGIGAALTRAALMALETRGETMFFVLGHPAFYPRMGFDAAKAAQVESPWGARPAFMARCGVAPTGRLVLPKAIDEAH